MLKFLEKIVNGYNEREIKKLRPIVDKVLDLEDKIKSLSDGDLKAKTTEFKERVAGGESLDDILPEAFAVVREASDRTLGMKHFPVQVMGGIGYTSVYPIERILRDIRLSMIWVGTNEIQQMIIQNEWYKEYFKVLSKENVRDVEFDAVHADQVEEKVYE